MGNKYDLEVERKVTKEERESIAGKYTIKFYEASNKDGTNVEESSRMLINLTLSKMSDDIKSNKTNKQTHLKLGK